MRILVIGPGALGIVAAVRLKRAGHDVEMAVRTQSKTARLNASGFAVTNANGKQVEARIPCVHDPRQSHLYDLIIHTTKCGVAEDVLAHWIPTLKDNGFVVPFQNGLMGDRLSAIAGRERYVECSIYWPAIRRNESHSEVMATGELVIGPWPKGAITAKHRELAGILEAVTPARLSDNMVGVKWSKLSINSAMLAANILSGASMGDMLRHRGTQDMFAAIVRETMAVAKASGVEPVRVGNANPALIAKLPMGITRLALKVLSRKYKGVRSSSAEALQRGEKTEVGYLNGAIAAQGDKVGVPTPVNDAVVPAVKAIESGDLESGFGLVEWLLAEA